MITHKKMTQLGLISLLLISASVSEVIAEERSTTTTVKTDSDGTKTWTSEENNYWSETYPSRPYYRKTTTYKTIEPAYQYGYEAYGRYNGKPFEEVEPKLRADWESKHSSSTVTWEDARGAVKDSYTHTAANGTDSKSHSRVVTDPDGSTRSSSTTTTTEE